MTHVMFISPYKPIMCGIADYTSFLSERMPLSNWGVLSFDIQGYGAPLAGNHKAHPAQVYYGIPDRESISASVIERGILGLGVRAQESILWFQHEFGLWPDDHKFTSMIRNLKGNKVITFHTLHFQSAERPSGLRINEENLLRELLPYVDAITVFSQGVYQAVTSVFPEHWKKVHIIGHGVPSYPEIARMSRREAKEKLHDFLIHESDLPAKAKKALHNQRTFLRQDVTILGETGFLCPGKQSEILYHARDTLQEVSPSQGIVAVRIGPPRDGTQKIYAGDLSEHQNYTEKFLLQTWLSPDMLPVAQRAFDINWYWPKQCTQSGIIAHALGAGATIAGRDMEGTGETLRQAGAITDRRLNRLVRKMRHLIEHPDMADDIAQKALQYSSDYSWDNQAAEHLRLAKNILYPEDSAGLRWIERVNSIGLQHQPSETRVVTV